MTEESNTEIQEEDLYDFELSPFVEFRETKTILGQFLSKHFKDLGLHPSSAHLLALIEATPPPIYAARLVKITGVSPPTLHRAIRLLERKGLVKKREKQVAIDSPEASVIDVKILPIKLTPEGAKKAKRARATINRLNKDIINTFGFDRWKKLRGELTAFSESLDR